MQKNPLFFSITIAWLAAGTLDILGAIFILGKGSTAGTFKYIAVAVTGKDVELDETSMLILGAGFHYLIALCWTITYFILYERIYFHKLNIILSALLYGSFIFFSMRYVFVPLLGQLPSPKPVSRDQLPIIIKNILILTVAFGITLKYFAARYFKSNP